MYADVSLGSGAGQAVLKAHSTSQSARTRGENDRSWRQGPQAPFPGLEPAFRGFKNRDLRAFAEAGRRAEPTGSILASVTQGHQRPCDGAPSSPPPKGPRDIHESPGFRRPHPQWRAGLRANTGCTVPGAEPLEGGAPKVSEGSQGDHGVLAHPHWFHKGKKKRAEGAQGLPEGASADPDRRGENR